MSAPGLELPPGRRILVVDDAEIASLDNLERRSHQPAKRGAVIRSADPAQTVQTRSVPCWEPTIEAYQLWVTGTSQPLRRSPDGLHWSAGPEPNLRTDHVVRDGLDPDPGRRYKAALLNTGFAVSPDGVAWTGLDVPAVPSADEGNLSHDPDAALFIHTVKRTGPFGRAVAVATSRDFQHWDDLGVVFHADQADQEIGRQRIAERLADRSLQQTEYDTPEHYSVQVYNMGVFRYEGLYIGLPSMYHHTGMVPPDWPGFAGLRLSPYIRECVSRHGDYTGFYTIQLASSRDLRHWQRPADRAPFLATSPLDAGAYDVQTLIGPSSPLVRGDELWFYYTGIRNYAFITSGGEPGYDDYRPDKGAICLAVLRRDGFVSLDAGSRPGVMRTRLLRVSGKRLAVNVAAGAGELVVEVVDPDGAVLATSTPVRGDAARVEVTWAEGSLAPWQGHPAGLRFTLRRGSLYSYWFED